LPLAAQGEFALMKEQLEFAFSKPFDPGKWGSNGTDIDLNAIYVDAAERQRDEQILRERAPILEALATRSEHKLYQAIAERALGIMHRLAGEFDPAQMRFTHALELFQSLGTRWQIGRTFAEFGELELSRQDSSRAHEYFSRALTEFELISAVPDATRTRERLENLR
jgi:tetratricopeptide (TPR) repeat protein